MRENPIRRRHLLMPSWSSLWAMTKLVTKLILLSALNNFVQSINIIESPRLRAIFLMLREELSDSDIPCRTTIRHRIEEVFEEHLCELEQEMKVGFPLKFFKRFLCS
jgi:hypothetical protein